MWGGIETSVPSNWCQHGSAGGGARRQQTFPVPASLSRGPGREDSIFHRACLVRSQGDGSEVVNVKQRCGSIPRSRPQSQSHGEAESQALFPALLLKLGPWFPHLEKGSLDQLMLIVLQPILWSCSACADGALPDFPSAPSPGFSRAFPASLLLTAFGPGTQTWGVGKSVFSSKWAGAASEAVLALQLFLPCSEGSSHVKHCLLPWHTVGAPSSPLLPLLPLILHLLQSLQKPHCVFWFPVPPSPTSRSSSQNPRMVPAAFREKTGWDSLPVALMGPAVPTSPRAGFQTHHTFSILAPK